jgi:hypothetical protein
MHRQTREIREDDIRERIDRVALATINRVWQHHYSYEGLK